MGMFQKLAASKESPASRARETREASAGDFFLGIWGTPFLRHPQIVLEEMQQRSTSDANGGGAPVAASGTTQTSGS